MSRSQWSNLILLNILSFSLSQRRITNGSDLTTDKGFVVYIMKTLKSRLSLDNEWLCGGAIVSPEYIISSAACMKDVGNTYAVPGYKTYVKLEGLYTDECTKTSKRRLVSFSFPKQYKLDFDDVTKWSYVDIALAKVKTPFDLDKVEAQCSYKASIIPVNYVARFQKPGSDVIAYGWGHEYAWRMEGDYDTMYNSKTLKYTSTRILDKKTCKSSYETYPKLAKTIDEYMICTADEGFLDDQGNVKVKESPFLTGCSKEKRGPTFLDYEESYQEVVIDSTRKKFSGSFNGTVRNKTVTKLRRRRIPRRRTRRQYGICQNDHGGPLTTWVGNSEILVGVATMFRVNRSSWNACIGPHLFTSTLCNGEFIDCTLSNKTSRRSVCDAPAIMRGYHVIENYVHWTTDRESDDENDTHTVIEQFVDGVKTPYKPLEPTLLPVLDLYHENSSDTLPAI